MGELTEEDKARHIRHLKHFLKVMLKSNSQTAADKALKYFHAHGTAVWRKLEEKMIKSCVLYKVKVPRQCMFSQKRWLCVRVCGCVALL